MGKKFLSTIIFFLTVFLQVTAALAVEPHLVKSIPLDGADNVSLKQGRVVLYFDQNMKMNSWSLVESPSHPFPPIKPIEEPWIDPLTFELEIKELRANTVYSIQLNSKKRKGFVSAETQAPLPITTITFSTGTAGSEKYDVTDEKAANSKENATSSNKKQDTPITISPKPGWKFNVTRSTGMEGTETYENGFQAPFRYFQKILFDQTITQAEKGKILKTDRTIRSAQLHSLNLETGHMVSQDIVPPGTTFRVQNNLNGSDLFDSATGQQIWDTDMKAAFASALAPALWPEGVLQEGQNWSYQGRELEHRIALIDAIGGQINLAVEKIAPEPSTGINTAYIRGKLNTKVDLDAFILDFSADVSIDLPLSLNIPFMVKFEGNLSGNGSVMDNTGQKINYQIKAQGSLLQIVKPSNEILNTFGSDEVIIEKGKIDSRGALKIPRGKNSGAEGDQTDQKLPVYRYRLYEDTTEKAFTVMIPEGWKTEGGIMSIAPGQIRTVVDGCGKKLHFSIYDPKTQASITYFPTDIFGTTPPGTPWLQVQPGQVLNGMIQMPQVLSPTEYVRQYMFNRARPDASQVQWGKVKRLTSLAEAWNKAFHSEDQIPPVIVAESIEVAYERNGTRFAELWTALITSVTVNNNTIWMPDFAVAAGAPVSVVEEMAPVLKAVITSFRMNPTWMARTIVHFDACTKGVAEAQDKIRTIDRQISQQLRKVQQQISDIDNEIVANRNNTRSVIQEHEHNTLVGVDKYEDPDSGSRYLIDMGYERNLTNGETIIQTNDWTFETPAGYRDMKNIHITDE